MSQIPRILITGASGALGQALQSSFSQNNYKLFTVSSENSDNDFCSIKIDLRKEENIKKIIKKFEPDYIFHLCVSYADCFNDLYLTNVYSSKMILDYVKKNNLSTKITLIGSAAEYGINYLDNLPFHEEMPLRPATNYALTKTWQSTLVKFYSQFNVNVTCARIFNLYGKSISRNLLPGYLEKEISCVKLGQKDSISLGSLNDIRDYISLDKAVSQIKRIAEKGLAGQFYNVGTGNPMIVRDFVAARLAEHGLSINIITENESIDCRTKPSVSYADMSKTNNLCYDLDPFNFSSDSSKIK